MMRTFPPATIGRIADIERGPMKTSVLKLDEYRDRQLLAGLRQFSLRIHSRKAASEIPTPGTGQSPLGTHDPKRKYWARGSRHSGTIGVSRVHLPAMATPHRGRRLFPCDNLSKNNPPLLKIFSLILRHLPKISAHEQMESKGRKAFLAYLLGQGHKPLVRRLCRV